MKVIDVGDRSIVIEHKLDDCNVETHPDYLLHKLHCILINYNESSTFIGIVEDCLWSEIMVIYYLKNKIPSDLCVGANVTLLKTEYTEITPKNK